MEKQSLPQTENLQFQFSFFRNTWSKESTIITLYNLYLQTIGTLWKAQTECYRKLQDRPDRSNEAKMVKDAMPVVIIEGICRPHCSHAAANLEKMSRLAMYDLDHLNERTSAVKVPPGSAAALGRRQWPDPPPAAGRAPAGRRQTASDRFPPTAALCPAQGCRRAPRTVRS